MRIKASIDPRSPSGRLIFAVMFLVGAINLVGEAWELIRYHSVRDRIGVLSLR